MGWLKTQPKDLTEEKLNTLLLAGNLLSTGVCSYSYLWACTPFPFPNTIFGWGCLLLFGVCGFLVGQFGCWVEGFLFAFVGVQLFK